jgi:hypothetical protein
MTWVRISPADVTALAARTLQAASGRTQERDIMKLSIVTCHIWPELAVKQKICSTFCVSLMLVIEQRLRSDHLYSDPDTFCIVSS